MKRIVFSGIQPTAAVPHIGNYLGAVNNWIRLQNNETESYSCIFSIADLHALTSINSAASRSSISQNSRLLATALIASGISADKSILFLQSSVKYHAQLSWILSCLASFGSLNRMTQWKSKDQTKFGLFAYPVLQAADILLYGTDYVPVGEDQIQHLELARSLAAKLNKTFGTKGSSGQLVRTPKALLTETPRIMSLRDPLKKMSKSDADSSATLFITDTPDVIRRKINRAVTDSLPGVTYNPTERPGLANLMEIMASISGCSAKEIEKKYSNGDGGAEKQTALFKQELVDLLIDRLTPIQREMARLSSDEGRSEVDRVLDRGASLANEIAEKNYQRLADAIGIK